MSSTPTNSTDNRVPVCPRCGTARISNRADPDDREDGRWYCLEDHRGFDDPDYDDVGRAPGRISDAGSALMAADDLDDLADLLGGGR